MLNFRNTCQVVFELSRNIGVFSYEILIPRFINSFFLMKNFQIRLKSIFKYQIQKFLSPIRYTFRDLVIQFFSA